MTTIVVIGARGFLGARVADATRLLPNTKVVTAGRHPQNQRIIDVSDPATFTALDAADLVVNCSDSLAAAPDALVAHCAQAGLPMIETTAHAPTIERLLDHGLDGPLLLGAGIFPGLSNLAARSAHAGNTGEPVSIGVRSSPASGAGAGTVALMVDLMALPALSFRDDVRIEERAFGRVSRFRFGRKVRRAVPVRLPEATMFHRATGADVRTLFAPMPGFITPLLRLFSRLMPRGPLARRIVRAKLRLLRSVVLRWRNTPVEIAAECAGDRRALRVRDGMRAAAAAVAAMADALRSGSVRLDGPRTPEQLFGIRDIIARMERLSVDVELAA